MLDRTIIEDALLLIVSSQVAHYTRIGTLIHFIGRGVPGWVSARATPVQFLNDRMELSLGLEVLRDVASRKPRSGAKSVMLLTIFKRLLESLKPTHSK